MLQSRPQCGIYWLNDKLRKRKKVGRCDVISTSYLHSRVIARHHFATTNVNNFKIGWFIYWTNSSKITSSSASTTIPSRNKRSIFERSDNASKVWNNSKQFFHLQFRCMWIATVQSMMYVQLCIINLVMVETKFFNCLKTFFCII